MELSLLYKEYETYASFIVISGSSHSDKEVDALTPEKSTTMRGSTVAPSTTLVPPSGAAPTIAMPERKRKRKGKANNLSIIHTYY